MNKFIEQFYEIVKPQLHIYGPIIVVYLIFLIYCIANLVKKKNFSITKKILWILIILFVQIIGPIAYVFIGRKND